MAIDALGTAAAKWTAKVRLQQYASKGTTQSLGSHGRVHRALADAHIGLNKRGKIAPDGSMNMKDVLDAAADSHEEASALSKCSKKCIRAQLESYYKACKHSRPKMINAQAKHMTPGATDGRTS